MKYGTAIFPVSFLWYDFGAIALTLIAMQDEDDSDYITINNSNNASNQRR